MSLTQFEKVAAFLRLKRSLYLNDKSTKKRIENAKTNQPPEMQRHSEQPLANFPQTREPCDHPALEDNVECVRKGSLGRPSARRCSAACTAFERPKDR